MVLLRRLGLVVLTVVALSCGGPPTYTEPPQLTFTAEDLRRTYESTPHQYKENIGKAVRVSGYIARRSGRELYLRTANPEQSLWIYYGRLVVLHGLDDAPDDGEVAAWCIIGEPERRDTSVYLHMRHCVPPDKPMSR